MKEYAVLVYFEKDQILRVLPQYNLKCPRVPLLNCGSICDSLNPTKIGEAYFKAADTSIQHENDSYTFKNFGKEHTAFKGFSSRKNFFENNICIATALYNGTIKFRHFPKQKDGTFTCLTTDKECVQRLAPNINLMYGISAEDFGKALLDFVSEIDTTFPEYHLFGDEDNTYKSEFSLANNQTTLFVKGEKAEFKKVLSTICDVEPEKDSFNEYTSYAAEEYSCFVEESIENLQTLSKACDELFCFASYSVVGFYGFFHFKNGKCMRAFATLDEDGTVQYSIGNPCRAEKELKLDLPKDTDQMIAENFLGLDFEILQKIAQLLLQ